jgi:hypothetical protein
VLRTKYKQSMKVLPDDPVGIVSLTAQEIVCANAGDVAKSPYYLRQPCHVNIGSKAAKPIFMAMMKMPPVLADAISFSFIKADQFGRNKLVWQDHSCPLLYGFEPVEPLLQVIKHVVERLAAAINAKVSRFEYKYSNVAEPVISVSLHPI